MSASDTQSLYAYCPPHLRASALRLVPLLYADLKRMAQRERGRNVSSQTLATTALVHETFLRLSSQAEFESHGHFLRVAAITMRHLLIDRARTQLALTRGGGAVHLPLDEDVDFVVDEDETVAAVHETLLKLARIAPRLAEIVECRFFAGYGDKETAQALGISERTVQRDWALARAWLRRELGSWPQ